MNVVPASTAHPAVAPAATFPKTTRQAGTPATLATSTAVLALDSSADASVKCDTCFLWTVVPSAGVQQVSKMLKAPR